MQRTAILNGSNLNQDKDYSLVWYTLMTPWVVEWLQVTTNSVWVWKAFIQVTRTSVSPNDVFYIVFENTSAVTIDTSGTKKVFVRIPKINVNDPWYNLENIEIAKIETDTVYPVSDDYIPLASITGWVITDARSFVKLKGRYVDWILTTKEATPVASASTVNLSSIDWNFVHITGTTTITSFWNVSEWAFEICFDSAGLTITNGSIRLPTGANIVTQAGDTMIVRWETTTWDWRVISYQRKDGTPLSQPEITRVKFWWDWSDGALNISSWTTSLTLVNNFLEKKYSSITISWSAILDITWVSGSEWWICILRCKWDLTMSWGTIRMNWQWWGWGWWVNGASWWNWVNWLNFMYNSWISNAWWGWVYTSTSWAAWIWKWLSVPLTLNRLKAYCWGWGWWWIWVSWAWWNWWKWGWILIIEVGGNLNFTWWTIESNWANWTSGTCSGGWGWGGWFICIHYNTLVSNAWTKQCNWWNWANWIYTWSARGWGGWGGWYSNGWEWWGALNSFTGANGVSNSYWTGWTWGVSTWWANAWWGWWGWAWYYEVVKNTEIA